MTAHEARAYIAAHQPELDSALKQPFAPRYLWANQVNAVRQLYDRGMVTGERIIQAAMDWQMIIGIKGE